MKLFQSVIVLALVFIVGASVKANTQALSLPLVQETIMVDGMLNEHFYQQATWNDGFYAIIGPNEGSQESRFLLFADNQNLYLSAILEEPSSYLPMPVRRADGVLLLNTMERNDSFALSLAVKEDRSEFVRYILNPKGDLLKLAYSQDGYLVQSVETQARVAVKVDKEKKWTFELAIPLVELDIDPEYRDWLFQVMRNRRERPADPTRRFWERSIGTPVQSGEDVTGFAKLLLGKLDLRRYAWGIETSESKVIMRDKEYHFSQVVKLENRTGKDQDILLKTELANGVGGELRLPVKGGGSEQLQLVFNLGKELPKESMKVWHTLFLDSNKEKSDETAVATYIESVAMIYEPVQIKLTAPGYRATIFKTQNLQEIKGDIYLVDDGYASGHLTAFVVDAKGSEFAAELEQLESNRWGFSVEGVPNMAEGTLLLRVSGGIEKKSWKVERKLRKVPYQKGEAWIDEKGIVYRDGKPLPIYGFLYGHWRDFNKRKIPGVQMNLGGPLHVGKNWQETLNLINTLAKQGIYAGPWAPTGISVDGANDGRRISGRKSLNKKERNEYARLARFFRNQENMLYYYLFDEPEGTGAGGVSPDILREIYEILRDEDPYHPVVILNHTINGVKDYQYGSDISNPDPYPTFLEGGGASRSISRYGVFLDQIKTGEESYRAKWITPQAFDWTYYSAEFGRRGPTVREMRTQQLISLMHGAIGVSWYPEYLAWDEVGVFTSLPYLSKEYEFLFPRLVEKRPEILQTSKNGTVALTGKEGEWVLMASNTLWKDVEIEISDPRLATISEWIKLGTGERVEGGKEKLRVQLKPHESLMLGSVNMAWPKDLDWSAVEKEEERVNKELVIPGNLAHRSRGVIAEIVNSSGRSQVRPMYMINGIKDSRALGFYHGGFEPGLGARLTFPKNIKASKIVLFESNIKKGVIEIEQNGEWVSVAQIEAKGTERETSYNLKGIEFSKLRILAQEINHANTLRILEVEIYE